MGEQTTLLRQWLLIKLLGSRNLGLTVRELSVELEVSGKTIRRDLATFFAIGFPVEETAGDYGRKSYRLRGGRNVPDLTFAFDEALALYLGRRFLQPLAGTVLGNAAASAFRKIQASVGTRVLKYLDKMSRVFHETNFGTSDYAPHGAVLDNLLVGIEDRRVVWITYRSQRSTEAVTYDIHPYRITNHRGSLYLLGYKVQDEELRTWRVDRIEAAEIDSVPFTLPPDLDLDARLAGSFGIYDGGAEPQRVTIRFLPAVARFVQEKKWHASQQFSPQRDGSVLAEFHLSSTVEVKDWVLSFGRHAEVLEPEALRSELAQELEQTLARYRSAPASSAQVSRPRRNARPQVSPSPGPTPVSSSAPESASASVPSSAPVSGPRRSPAASVSPNSEEQRP